METQDLIRALQADAGQRPAAPSRAWALAGLAALVAAAAAFLILIGPRPDFMDAMQTVRFVFKFVVTLALAGTAFRAAQLLARPGADVRRALPLLAVAPALLVAAVALEMMVVPPERMEALWIGRNMMTCMTSIPLIGLGPLALFLLAMRHGAPTRPALSGAVAGLLAGGLAATFYAAHCTDDSPFFVASWYTLAMIPLVAAGAVGGRLALRW